MTWPRMTRSELLERFNALGPDRLVKVLLFERWLGLAAPKKN